MNVSDDELKRMAQDEFDKCGFEVGSVYRHYKGGVYVIVALSLKEDTLEPLVTYRSNLKGTFWTRTLGNFIEEVRVPVGQSPVPRFEWMEG